MIKNYNDLILNIFYVVVFICLFIKISEYTNTPIEFGNTYINSAFWGFIILIGILIYLKVNKFVGTLLFILILLYYKKFFKDPFSLHESFYVIIEQFQQKNKNLGDFKYATKITEIPYSLNKYPVDFEIQTTNTFPARGNQ